MDIPASVSTCQVEGVFLEATLDSVDIGDRPDMVDVPGLTVVLESTWGEASDRPVVLRVPDPAMQLLVAPVVLQANQAGRLVNPANPDEPPLVVATDQVFEDRDFVYRVTASAPGWPVLTGYASAPAGGVLDVTAVMDFLEVAPQEKAEFIALAEAIVAARNQVLTARDQVLTARDEVNAIVLGDVFDDTVVSSVLGWSSAKIDAAKADTVHGHDAADVVSGVFASARLPAASESVAGAVELASAAEAVAGVDTARAVTPVGMVAAIKDRAVLANPADYGVNVAGVDTTTSFQAMVAALPAGAEIVMRPGQVVNLNGEVLLSKPVTVSGGTIHPVEGGKTLTIGADDVKIKGVRFAGARSGLTAAGEYFISSDAIDPDTYYGALIEGCTLEGTNHSGIWVTGLTDFDIRDNRIIDGEYAGIMGLSVRRGRITGNRIIDMHQSGTLVNSYGIAISDSLNTAAGRSEHVHVDGNHIDGIRDWTALDTHSGFDIKFTNNTALNCRNGVAVTAGNELRTTAPEDCWVSGNYLEKGTANSQSHAIVFTGKSGGGLPDRIAWGTIGTNIIRGYTSEMLVNKYDPAKTIILPQSFDGAYSGRTSPMQQTFREYDVLAVVPVAGAAGGTVGVTLPAGYFTLNPIVTVARHAAQNATAIPYVVSSSVTEVVVGVYNSTGASFTGDVSVHVHVRQPSRLGNGHPRP